MTAYRQQALAVVAALAVEEADGTPARRPRDLKAIAPDAPKILLHNVYGWFARVERELWPKVGDGRWAQAATWA